MKALNLKEFKLFTDISHAGHIVVDARNEFANAIYMSMNGIVAHDLAFRILHSEGGIEVSDEEESIIVDTAKMCKAVFYDSIMSALKKE